MNIFNYNRRKTTEVNIGACPLGGDNPIRVQSMTNTSTTDTEGCVAQAKRIVDAGGEYVRLTTQGIREAENLKAINIGLRQDGYTVPLVADVHFNAAVADVAAQYAEKVRVNPGNYVDPGRKFKHIDYTDEEYAEEIAKIEARFVPFLDICKKNHTAIRIGVNHGSLSDRIMSRYGDTPEGMAESCMEFLRICVRQNFSDVVISIKASNTVIMVRTVRLLVDVMEKEGMAFPLHIGVTEAGDGEDGRIKSAVGIGALLCDGIGDTIRVSLSEAPEAEIPVALKLRDYVAQRGGHPFIPGIQAECFDYIRPSRRTTRAVGNIGGNHAPVVIGSDFRTQDTDGRAIQEQFKPDYLYCGSRLPEKRVAGVSYITDATEWENYSHDSSVLPAFSSYGESAALLPLMAMCHAPLKFLFATYATLTEEVLACLRVHPEIVVISQSNHPNRLGEHRALVHELMANGIENPVVIFQHYNETDKEDLQIKSAADMGALCIDGLVDGIYLHNNSAAIPADIVDSTAFSILQAARLRTSKTEYISCPGCGRTLYDLEATIKRIKEATSHLCGLKIGIMGCIVNGPGEMADADYGYVGAGVGKVSLYKGKVCVEKNIPSEEAVGRLLEFIESDMKQQA
ncbi:MAG: 4-hydroxy-3-methylbut-2-en-1-yl diphosphate synthase [Bacteroides sp.]|nr:4-hydroxy-3-methylbut-2-en-1-yl diphosphate synthase [Roseburia sp.]MCM1347761.1 4-hydroxy-3-methylbut-2-en-1-yl diphosphate synthase [Bacteroides sp.]MCM1422171.1 4-hydroxy-3-methylbut-2-en-1-yl diphosphate synthase [Bacteroides sp.]